MQTFFEKKDWERINSNFQKWWNGDLERPLILMTLTDCPTNLPKPKLDFRHFTSFYELAIPAEQIAEVWNYEISKRKFIGDGFPSIWPNFGPGVIAAFLGAKLENGKDTVWFHPAKEREISEIEFNYDPQNVWLNRVKDIIRAAQKIWGGTVQIGMTDLGGNLDILSSFRPSEGLLLDLYDNPEHVKRLTWQAHELWWKYYNEFADFMSPLNPGYSAWTPLFSKTPYYILQCDFCYMISPEMFDEFVKPELESSCRKLDNAFYHLDGVGQLPHLDSLLQIKELKGVQWVPGDGKPSCEHWPEVYKKIREAGKLIQLWGNYATLDILVEQLGSAKGIAFMISERYSEQDKAIKFLEKYKVI